MNKKSYSRRSRNHRSDSFTFTECEHRSRDIDVCCDTVNAWKSGQLMSLGGSLGRHTLLQESYYHTTNFCFENYLHTK